MRKLALLLSCALCLVSCSKQEEAPYLSVSPNVLELDAAAASKVVALSTNSDWKAAVNYEDGPEGWVSLSTNRAPKGCSVTVRVTDNTKTTARTATIVFSLMSGKADPVEVRVSQEKAQYKASLDLKIGSYNIRYIGGDSSSDTNKWEVRKARLFQSIRENDFDIFGVQEVVPTQQSDLEKEFSSVYGVYCFSPRTTSGVGGEAIGVLYKKDKFTISGKQRYWLGDDPSQYSQSDVGAKKYARGGCCCVLTHKETGVKLFFMCSHGCLYDEPNLKFAPLYVTMEKKYNPEGLPSFFVGDLNTTPSSATSTILCAHWKDAYSQLTASQRSGCDYTYNAYQYPSGKPGSRIDFIYYRGADCYPLSYCCNNTLYSGLYPSDHFPLWTVFRLCQK